MTSRLYACAKTGVSVLHNTASRWMSDGIKDVSGWDRVDRRDLAGSLAGDTTHLGWSIRLAPINTLTLGPLHRPKVVFILVLRVRRIALFARRMRMPVAGTTVEIGIGDATSGSDTGR